MRAICYSKVFAPSDGSSMDKWMSLDLYGLAVTVEMKTDRAWIVRTDPAPLTHAPPA
jgi:extradiol dioxygenase family protein